MVFDASIAQMCLRNQNGECHYRECDVYPCGGMCNLFVTFDKTLCNKAGVTPVGRWEYEHKIKKRNI
ncbi:MAG TPA: hypothetical protein VMY59_08865 [Candidatus Thermoplasmatota archaeon]|nr:hypothetical protein [Candidatus Thermoplasmatota archaeon]